MKNKPSYSIGSVDHALQLAQLLQHEGSLRVTDAAERVGVSRSTAHRLLAMLVYRGFAEQGDDRRYHAGEVLLRPAEISEAPVTTLRRSSLPHLHALSERVRETTNLMVRVGTNIRFIATVESDRPLRVGDRVGRALAAHLTSGGQALLARLSPEELSSLYEHHPDVDLPRLRRKLALVRKRGFATNHQQTETGLTALGMTVHAPSGEPCAALSIALPSARFDREQLPTWIGALSAAATMIQRDLATQDGYDDGRQDLEPHEP